jgi:hypothetical protein
MRMLRLHPAFLPVFEGLDAGQRRIGFSLSIIEEAEVFTGRDLGQVAKLCRNSPRTHPQPAYAPPARSLPQLPRGSNPLGEARLAALSHQLAGEHPRINLLRVIAKEPDKSRNELDDRLRLPSFPVVNCPGVHAKPTRCFFLGDREDEPAATYVLAQGPRLEVTRFPNQ